MKLANENKRKRSIVYGYNKKVNIIYNIIKLSNQISVLSNILLILKIILLVYSKWEMNFTKT